MTNLHTTLKQRHCFANKGASSQSYGFSGSHVWMWELDLKESWAPKNWCFWTVELDKALENPLDSKEIKPVNPKGNKPWIVFLMWRADSLKKILMLGKIEGRRRKMTEDEMVGWHHQLDGRWVWANSRSCCWIQMFGWHLQQSLGDSEGQRRCSPWGRKESDMTEWVGWTELKTCCCCCSVVQWCLTVCDPMDCSTPGFPCPNFLTSYFCIPIQYDERISFLFLVLVLEGLVGLHRTPQLQLL